MNNISWIKITTDIFNDEKILLIESMAPEHDAVIVIWFKLLTLAGRTNNNGVFMINDKLAYTDEMLATIFRRPAKTVKLALEIFESLGMIEIINNVITIPNWEKHQNTDALEKSREQTRKRVAAFREKQKKLISTDNSNESESNIKDEYTETSVTEQQCNDDVTLPVTQSNATEKRREDKEKNREERDIDREREEKIRGEENIIPPSGESNFSFNDCVQQECFADTRQAYEQLHKRWVEAGLPLSTSSAQSYFTFSCRELKNALGTWSGMGVRPEELMPALENFIKLADLIKSGDSWMDTVGNFSYFAKHFLEFLEGDFNLDKYKKRVQPQQENKSMDMDAIRKRNEELFAEWGIEENN